MSATVGSLFSGIGGFDLGLERAGWTVRWQVESNPFRRQVLKRHWPQVELRNDIRTDTNGLERPDLICGGFPCQDVSVAGKREGLAGERSSLWYEFARIVADTRPPWVLVENVPGLLSSNEGKDFEIVVSGLAECGYGVAWRVLDSQNFGVPQRRRRVFIVGYLGAPCPPEVLFESEGSGGDSAAGEEAKKEVTNSLRASTGSRGTDDPDRYPAYIPEVRTFARYSRSGRHTVTDWRRNYETLRRQRTAKPHRRTTQPRHRRTQPRRRPAPPCQPMGRKRLPRRRGKHRLRPNQLRWRTGLARTQASTSRQSQQRHQRRQ